MLERSVFEDGVRRPQATDELISLLLFHARDGLTGLKTPLDVAAWWVRYADEFDDELFASVLRDHPQLARPTAAASLAVEELLEVPSARLFPAAAVRARRTRAALGLVDWANVRPEPEAGVAVKVVDGLLTDASGVPEFVLRAAFPVIHGSPIGSVVSRLMHALHFVRYAIPMTWRSLRSV